MLTSRHPRHVSQNLSTSLSIPGHQTFYRILCFMLTILGSSSWASISTRGLNLLGTTILVPLQRISLPITHSSMLTGMYCLCRSAFHVLFLMQLRSSTNTSSSTDASLISHVVVARGVADVVSMYCVTVMRTGSRSSR